MKTPLPAEPTELSVPLERVAKFLRQLTHDVRNGLSAIDLEAAFVAELSDDAEVLAELRKLREMVADTAKMLREVSQNFQPVTVHCISWAAQMVMDELVRRLQAEYPEEAQTVAVVSRFGEETLELDLNQTLAALMAVLNNAFQCRQEGASVRVMGAMEGGRAVIEVREAKPTFESQTPPEQWGAEPLRSTRSGGYGLGLYHARQIAVAQGGSLETSYTGSELVTRMLFGNTEEK